MSGGLFLVDRGIFDHPEFADEPFTEREAWLWLVSEAAWRPRRVRHGSGVIELERGQLSHSQRFVATKWGWSRGKVSRFLKLLENEGMIEPATVHRQSVITICNYERFQDFERYREPQSEPPANRSSCGKRATNGPHEVTNSSHPKQAVNDCFERGKPNTVEEREPPNDHKSSHKRATNRASNGAKEEHQITPDKHTADDARARLDDFEACLVDAGGAALNRTQPGLSDLSVPIGWLESGCDLTSDVLRTIARVAGRAPPGSIRSWKYFSHAVAEAKANRETSTPEVSHAPHTRKDSVLDTHLSAMFEAARELSEPDDPGDTG